MRDVLTLSLPTTMKKSIKNRAKNRGFSSVSEYVKFLFIEDEDLISQDELLKAAKEADREYKEGNLIEADSLLELYDHK